MSTPVLQQCNSIRMSAKVMQALSLCYVYHQPTKPNYLTSRRPPPLSFPLCEPLYSNLRYTFSPFLAHSIFLLLLFLSLHPHLRLESSAKPSPYTYINHQHRFYGVAPSKSYQHQIAPSAAESTYSARNKDRAHAPSLSSRNCCIYSTP